MLGIMIQKVWHKRWMNLSLLLGCILLVATVVSFPLYQKAAYDRMLTDEFNNYIASEGDYPAYLYMTSFSNKEKGGKTINKMSDMMSSIASNLGLKGTANIEYYLTSRYTIHSNMNRADAMSIDIALGGMTDLVNHADIISGEPYSELGKNEKGEIEVMLTQDCMVSSGILIGESLTFDSFKDYNGEPITIYVKGVFNPLDVGDFYYQSENTNLTGVALMNMDLFKEMFTGDHAGKYSIQCHYYSFFDYKALKSEQIGALLENTKYYTDKSAFRSVLKTPKYVELLENYTKKTNRISATLLILQIPVLVMLSAFLFMISGQMYEMEKSEISVIKSRGSSRFQIFRLYLYQGLVLSIIGGLIGVPLGALFSRLLGSVENFLEFNSGRVLEITYTNKAYIYALVAMIINLLSMTIPAIGHSKVSIVKLKQSKNTKKKVWWERFYIDIVLLGISLYGYYSFNRNSADVSGTVLSGQSLDPLLYVSSSLFIVGMGLLFLRIQPLIIKLIFSIRKNRWKPAAYISLMEGMRSAKKMQLIILFLIMTVSLGMYHSTVARTILENAVNNVDYIDSVDVVIKEKWPAIVDQEGMVTGAYLEPDVFKYTAAPWIDSFTKVYVDESAFVSSGKDKLRTTVMGLNTKEFGLKTSLSKDIIEKPYYEYLNDLAVVENGAIVSRNFQTKEGYEVGDNIYVSGAHGETLSCKIVDFIDYFPSFTPTKTDLNPDGSSFVADNYLVVTHFDLTKRAFGSMPYEMWIKKVDGTTQEDIYKWLTDNDISLSKYMNHEINMKSTLEDPLLQGTNGVLTMGFVVTIILCGVGYLIYWIMSIKDRELVFGVLRASGFHKRELVVMLLNEQLFSGVLAVISGIGIGFLSSKMFVPIIQLSYASDTQVLPLKLIVRSEDLYRLYGVIGGVMILCLIALISILFHMNVTKALKLGEE